MLASLFGCAVGQAFVSHRASASIASDITRNAKEPGGDRRLAAIGAGGAPDRKKYILQHGVRQFAIAMHLLIDEAPKPGAIGRIELAQRFLLASGDLCQQRSVARSNAGQTITLPRCLPARPAGMADATGMLGRRGIVGM